MKNLNKPFLARGRTLTCAIGFLAGIGCTSVLWAQAGKGPVDVQLTAYKIVAKGEKDELAAADKIKPGETIEYQARYANNGTQSVKNLAATLPIPGGMEFVSGSALPDDAQASTDGKTFASLPLKRVSKSADGSTKVELIPLSQYRALRWSISELAAGKKVTVFARVRVLGPVKSASKSAETVTVGKEAGR